MKDVYSIEDLESQDILDAGSSKPAKLAVIGDPVAHSKSPQIHQAALDKDSFDMRYIRVHVPPGEVKNALGKMQQLGFIGVNVTVPHKLEVMSVCDSLTETAKALGAVNTVHFTENGWIGHNTDGPGLANALKSELNRTFADSSTLILGAGGGAGRAIAVQAALDKCPALTLSNRTIEKLKPIAEKIKAIHPHCDLKLISADPSEIAKVKAELVINSTSLGMKEEDASPYPLDSIEPHQAFYDAVYSPPMTTMLYKAQSIGCKVANGHGMLVYQGALSYQMWLDSYPDTQLMLEQIK